jgi:hypothetical protein
MRRALRVAKLFYELPTCTIRTCMHRACCNAMCRSISCTKVKMLTFSSSAAVDFACMTDFLPGMELAGPGSPSVHDLAMITCMHRARCNVMCGSCTKIAKALQCNIFLERSATCTVP